MRKIKKNKKNPYAFTVGCLMYDIVCTRLNFAHVIDVVSQFLSNFNKEYWTTIKWIFRYFRDTSTICLYFGNDKHVLDSYIDADIAGDINSRKFILGYLIFF